MEKFILALDQGTTSSRAILFDKSGNQVALAQKEFKQYYPQPGWVEHDPEEIWSTQFEVARQALANAGLEADAIEAIGITNQRETTVIWDRKSGNPVYNAIVWQDRRTAEWCDRLKARAGEVIQKKTGLIVDAYFSASKIKWILDEVPGLRSRAEAGELAFGTVDAWLLWKLTGGKVHATDITNASRTMLFDIRQLKWDDGLLELMDIPASLLPEVKSSSENFGTTQCLGGSIPVTGIAGDQQSALFGQMCSEKGMVKNTYGTGCFMLMNIGDQPLPSNHNLVTTVAWQLNGKVTYAFEGSIFIAGAVVQWLRDGLGIIKSAGEIEALAGSVPDNGGVYLVPAFAGLGAPHWNQHARGTMLGITRGTSAAHIARAALESIALQTLDVLKAMEADAGEPVKELRVDGGATANNLLLQIQADVLGANVLRPRITETTAIGAAYLAGLATGYWKDVDEIRQQWQVDRTFSPGQGYANSLVRNWNRAVRAAMSWANDNK